jgi:hypothetical protein
MPAAASALHPDLPGPADPHSMLRDGRRPDIDTRHKRLLFRSWHRGAQEIDLFLASFAERCVPASARRSDMTTTNAYVACLPLSLQG